MTLFWFRCKGCDHWAGFSSIRPRVLNSESLFEERTRMPSGRSLTMKDFDEAEVRRVSKEERLYIRKIDWECSAEIRILSLDIDRLVIASLQHTVSKISFRISDTFSEPSFPPAAIVFCFESMDLIANL